MHNAGTKVMGVFKASPAKLSDPGVTAHFLRRLVDAIGMTTLGNHIYDVPTAVKRLGQDPLTDEGGVTGIAVLTTSHAAIHTWPEEAAGRFDVDSCREFNPDTVRQVLAEVFEATDIRMSTFDYRYPDGACKAG